tara:strand:+ start:78 stop:305 length:228 start_codon:yes stop_codon:yes gene_type:complete
MIEALGWISTVLVLFGYILNAQKLSRYAMITWIIGDIGWVIYDFLIYNISHMALSFVIIAINIYGIWNICKTTKN